MTTAEFEKRLTAVEQELAHLKPKPNSKIHWWDKIAGKFANDPAFEEAMRLGRKWRESQRPKSRISKKRASPKRKAAK